MIAYNPTSPDSPPSSDIHCNCGGNSSNGRGRSGYWCIVQPVCEIHFVSAKLDTELKTCNSMPLLHGRAVGKDTT